MGWDVLFSGDSVLEFLRGTVIGRPWGLIADCAEAFHDQIARHYNTHVLAISGDYTSNLLWRVTAGGEMPKRQPKVVVIYIGSNDLSAADCGNASGEAALLEAVKPLLARVHAIVRSYRAALPHARLLLLGMMPRAGRYWEPDQRSVWPNAYTRPLAAVNAGYKAIAAIDPMVSYLACGQQLAPNLTRYTSDGIHPTAAGYDLSV
ncbi:hypothetical protein WJX81_002952 [Elliptochloris bilobata]|uniref:SGNH hydrolase-type esterase domain-containing protein n=1 Tax=Elliptochloris bilobata TaxID=381761 RepID=A0AAW1S089_9CHLO